MYTTGDTKSFLALISRSETNGINDNRPKNYKKKKITYFQRPISLLYFLENLLLPFSREYQLIKDLQLIELTIVTILKTSFICQNNARNKFPSTMDPTIVK